MNKKLLLLLALIVTGLHARAPKLIGLARVSNEPYLEQFLLALSCYTDAIVVMVTEPQEETLGLLERLKSSCSVERVYTQRYLEYNLPTLKNMLLQAGRELDGTHFLMIEPYQLLSAQCKQDNWFRNTVFTLKPGDSLQMMHMLLWRGVSQYTLMDPAYNACAFADDGYCFYSTSQGYLCNVPYELTGTRVSIDQDDYVLIDMHAQTELHQKSVYLWTQYEIRAATSVVHKAPAAYFAKLLQPRGIAPIKEGWLSYSGFNPDVYHQVQVSHLKGVQRAIEKRGGELFKDIGTMGLTFPDKYSEVTFWPQAPH